MSFWGATVITSLATVIPVVGEKKSQNNLLILLGLTELHWTRELFYFDNISAECVKLLLLKQTYKSILFLSETMDVFCLAGSAQQAQQSTHLAEGLNPL